MKPFKIGIDLGGTKTEAILLDEQNRELYRKRQPTPKNPDYRGILESIRSLISHTADHIPDENHYTIGIGIPGAINADTQLVHNANTTCLIGHPLQKDLETLVGQPVSVENDANCFTLAECRSGAGIGYGLVFGVIMGTGCGGGICIDGQIHQGRHGIAGEWGHVSVDPDGKRCYCGNRGCVETKISGSGVESAFFASYKKQKTFQEIVEGYHSNDTQCTTAFLQFIDDFGRCLGGLISILDPDAVVLGGGLSNIDALYSMGIEKVKQYVFHGDIQTPVLKNKLGDSAGVFGAAWIGAERERQ
jgi:fructokinase